MKTLKVVLAPIAVVTIAGLVGCGTIAQGQTGTHSAAHSKTSVGSHSASKVALAAPPGTDQLTAIRILLGRFFEYLIYQLPFTRNPLTCRNANKIKYVRPIHGPHQADVTSPLVSRS